MTFPITDNPLDQMLAAKSEARQIELDVLVARNMSAVDRSFQLFWKELVLIMHLKDPELIRVRTAELWAKLSPTLIVEMRKRLDTTVNWSYYRTAKNMIDVVPVGWWRFFKPELVEAEEGIKPLFTTGIPKKGKKTKEQQKTAALNAVFKPPTKDKVEEIVYASGPDGKNWEDRLLGLSSRITDPKIVADTIATMVSDGKKPAQIAKAIRPQVGGINSAARRIARNETRRISNSMQEEAWEKAGDIIVGFQIRATVDEATRHVHRERNGRIYYKNPGQGEWQVAQRPELPDAPNCRCWYTPVMRTPDWAGSNPDLLKQFESGTVTDPATHGEWFKTASVDQRRKAVGTRRYNLMRKILGEEPEYHHFVNNEDGNLWPLKKITKKNRLKIAHSATDNIVDMNRRSELIQQLRISGFLHPEDGTVSDFSFAQKAAVQFPVKPSLSGKGVEVVKTQKLGKSSWEVYKDGTLVPKPFGKDSHFSGAKNAKIWAAQIDGQLPIEDKYKHLVPGGGKTQPKPATIPKPKTPPKTTTKKPAGGLPDVSFKDGGVPSTGIEVIKSKVGGKVQFNVYKDGVLQPKPNAKKNKHFGGKTNAIKYAQQIAQGSHAGQAPGTFLTPKSSPKAPVAKKSASPFAKTQKSPLKGLSSVAIPKPGKSTSIVTAKKQFLKFYDTDNFSKLTKDTYSSQKALDAMSAKHHQMQTDYPLLGKWSQNTTFQKFVLKDKSKSKNGSYTYNTTNLSLIDSEKSFITMHLPGAGVEHEIAHPKVGVGNWSMSHISQGVNDTKVTYAHELGHAFEYTYINKIPQAAGDWASAVQDVTGQHVTTAGKTKFKASGKAKIKAGISNYAASNSNEVFAESFSAFTHPNYGKKGGKQLPKPIHDFFTDALVNEKYEITKTVVGKAKIGKASKPVTTAKFVPKGKSVNLKAGQAVTLGANKRSQGHQTYQLPKKIKTKVVDAGSVAEVVNTSRDTHDEQELLGWIGKAKPVERRAAKRYTKNGDEIVNGYLRGNMPSWANTTEAKKIDKGLQDVIKKHGTTTKGKHVYRGIHIANETKRDEFLNNLLEQGEVEFPAYLSTSISPRQAKSFSGGSDLSSFLFKIKPKNKGLYLGDKQASHFKHEEEFLMNKGSKFKVTRVVLNNKMDQYNNSTHVIELEEID